MWVWVWVRVRVRVWVMVRVCRSRVRVDAHGLELTRRKTFGEEVRHVFRSGDVGHNQLIICHRLAYEEVSTLDMLHTIMVFRIVGERNGSRIVTAEGHGRAIV